jgi:hypothetical protein
MKHDYIFLIHNECARLSQWDEFNDLCEIARLASLSAKDGEDDRLDRILVILQNSFPVSHE